MTENECVEILKEMKRQSKTILENPTIFYNEKSIVGGCETMKNHISTYEAAMKALEEIQQYRAIGTVEEIQNLAEYKDLEEQGKLLKLPCTMGDTVYCIYNKYVECSSHRLDGKFNFRKEYYIKEQKVYSLDWIVSNIKQFENLIFTTQEEAETALKEMSEWQI